MFESWLIIILGTICLVSTLTELWSLHKRAQEEARGEVKLISTCLRAETVEMRPSRGPEIIYLPEKLG